jgi:hypothetical protein
LRACRGTKNANIDSYSVGCHERARKGRESAKRGCSCDSNGHESANRGCESVIELVKVCRTREELLVKVECTINTDHDARAGRGHECTFRDRGSAVETLKLLYRQQSTCRDHENVI